MCSVWTTSGHFTCRDMWHHISRKKWWKSGKWPTSVERLATADESNRHLTTLLHTVKCEQTGCQPFSSDSYYFVLTFLNVHSSLPWRAKSTAKANTYRTVNHTVLRWPYTYGTGRRTVVQLLFVHMYNTYCGTDPYVVQIVLLYIVLRFCTNGK